MDHASDTSVNLVEITNPMNQQEDNHADGSLCMENDCTQSRHSSNSTKESSTSCEQSSLERNHCGNIFDNIFKNKETTGILQPGNSSTMNENITKKTALKCADLLRSYGKRLESEILPLVEIIDNILAQIKDANSSL